jgi:hypothetical protein
VTNAKRVTLLLVALGLCTYGLYCAWHMRLYIGTAQYWSNPWFYKAHACLAAIVILYLLIPRRSA